MDGRLDMAIDEALAEAVGNGDSPPVVRLYGFSPPTLSLGRFQKAKGLYSARRLAADGVTLVRRPTGGHAVLHDDELTYSVALPKEGGPVIGGGSGAHRRRGSARCTSSSPASSCGGSPGSASAAPSTRRSAATFTTPTASASAGEYEIAGTGGKKLIGSAQMTTRRAILQHGSIPLQNPGQRVFRYLSTAQPVAANPPSCLNEEIGRALAFEEVRDAFARAFRDEIGRRILGAAPRRARKPRERIRRDKYETDTWNLAC